MPRASSIASPARASTSGNSSAPKVRNTSAQGNALGPSTPQDLSPEWAGQPWRIVKLREVAESIQYGHTASSSKEEVGPRFLRITDIQDRNVDWGSVPFCEVPKKQIPKYLLGKGDLLFARTGATVGKSFLITTEIPVSVFASYLIRVRVTDEVDPRFVYYFFQSSDYWNQISESSAGIGQLNVNGTKLAALRLPLPPLPEQRRIVARIEELFSRLDAGVAALRHAKTQLQRYRQSVLAAAVTGKLTQAWREQHPDTEPVEELLARILLERRENWSARGSYKEPVATDALPLDIPSTWILTNIDSVISGIEAGKNFTCEERPPTEGETGLVKISAVTWGRFDELESKTVTRNDQIREEHLIHPGDFLLSRANTLELVGAPVIVEQITRHLMLSDKVLRFRFIEGSGKFALYWLRSKKGRKEIESRATGNQLSMRNIAQASLRAIPIPLPPLAEQHQIVAEVEARTTAIAHLEAELDRQITRSNRLRQSILATAFKGTLDETHCEERTL